MASFPAFLSPEFLSFLTTAQGVEPSPAPARSKLQSLIETVRIVGDGDVVYPEDHNSLRHVCRELVDALDESQFARVLTASFLPALLPIVDGAEPPWRMGLGYAIGPPSPDGGPGGAEGWMPIDLPDGTNVDSMVVRGSRPTKVAVWSAALVRIEQSSGEQAPVCDGEIHEASLSANGRFTATLAPRQEGKTPQQVNELRRIDTTKYRYAFHTTMAEAVQPDAVQLHLVQVTCTRG